MEMMFLIYFEEVSYEISIFVLRSKKMKKGLIFRSLVVVMLTLAELALIGCPTDKDSGENNNGGEPTNPVVKVIAEEYQNTRWKGVVSFQLRIVEITTNKVFYRDGSTNEIYYEHDAWTDPSTTVSGKTGLFAIREKRTKQIGIFMDENTLSWWGDDNFIPVDLTKQL